MSDLDGLFEKRSGIPDYNLPSYPSLFPKRPATKRVAKAKAKKLTKTKVVRKKRILTPAQQEFVAQSITDKIAMNKLRYMLPLD